MGSFVVSHLKGTDFDEVSDEELAKIEHILNTRGRESLGFYSLYDIFMQPRGGVSCGGRGHSSLNQYNLVHRCGSWL